MRQSPRYPEITVYPDGRMFDVDQERWLNVNQIHSQSTKGPVCSWTTNGKTHSLSVAKILYETYVSENIIQDAYTVGFKDGDESNIDIKNLKKVKKWEREPKEAREFLHDPWMNGDGCIFCG
jgi:hypothetical protein